MTKILHLISSPRGEESFSIKLGNAIIEKLQQRYPDSEVEVNNLVESNVPHVNSGHLRAFFTTNESLGAQEIKDIKYSDDAIAQLLNSDIIVVGAPLYNFGIPSTLKAWIDHIARVGKTFWYDETGAHGLVKDKKVYIALSAGAIYSAEPWDAYDFVEPYLKKMLGFLGMTDLTVYRVEGVNIPGIQEHALQKGIESIQI
jgi:FMN-dependent NADH-azoreductase